MPAASVDRRRRKPAVSGRRREDLGRENRVQAASLEGQPTIVWSVAVSADGKTLITSGYDGKIILWNVAEKKPQQTIEKKGWIRRVTLTPDGKNFAAGMEDGSVILFETDGGKG